MGRSLHHNNTVLQVHYGLLITIHDTSKTWTCHGMFSIQLLISHCTWLWSQGTCFQGIRKAQRATNRHHGYAGMKWPTHSSSIALDNVTCTLHGTISLPGTKIFSVFHFWSNSTFSSPTLTFISLKKIWINKSSDIGHWNKNYQLNASTLLSARGTRYCNHLVSTKRSKHRRIPLEIKEASKWNKLLIFCTQEVFHYEAY